MDIKELALKKHYEWNGKIEVVSRTPVKSSEDLSTAYTPGVAEPCLAIRDDWRGDSPAWSGRGSRPSRRTSG